METDSNVVRDIQKDATINDMSEHQNNDKPKPPKCSECDQMVAKKIYLNVHIRTHTEQNSYSCPQCEKCYNNSNSLTVHMYLHGGKHKCYECGKCCQSNSALTIHRRTHSGEKLFERLVCSKRFTQAGHYTRHSRIHSGQKPYKCNVCQKAFSQSLNLTNHVSVRSWS